MTATWPASIPTIEYDTISITPIDQRSVFTTDVGNPTTGSLSTTAQFMVRFDVIFTGGQLRSFWTWWEADLALGAVDFDGLEDVVEDVAARFKFATMPSFTQIRSGIALGDRRWRATFELWKV